MNLDEKITQALSQESQEIDRLMRTDDGLFSRLGKTFRGTMRGWLALVVVFGFLASVAIVFCAYQFWQAVSLDQQVQWGVWLIVALQVQIALKMWSFMEMNRTSLMREIKRVEIQVARTAVQPEQ